LRDPGREDAHAQSQLHQLLGRFHAAGLNHGVQLHLLAPEIIRRASSSNGSTGINPRWPS
jgi:hypothetical protein